MDLKWKRNNLEDFNTLIYLSYVQAGLILRNMNKMIDKKCSKQFKRSNFMFYIYTKENETNNLKVYNF